MGYLIRLFSNITFQGEGVCSSKKMSESAMDSSIGMRYLQNQIYHKN